MFTKPQLTLLIDAQQGDDWSTEGFLERVAGIGEETHILAQDMSELTMLLQSYTKNQIAALQMALTILGDLPTSQQANSNPSR